MESHYLKLNEQENINASEFELLTATAFTLFNEKKVDVGIVEVGMGGKLDATNVLNNQVVSIISKIALDHQGFLGGTIEEIAAHKAGILRPDVPYIVNPMNEIGVHQVIEKYANEIGAGPRILPFTEELQQTIFKSSFFHKFAEGKLPFQRDNAVLAFLAYLETLKSMGLSAEPQKALKLLSKLKNKRPLQGRQHEVKVKAVFGVSKSILVDGAHNADAAETLRDYVNLKLRGKLSKKNALGQNTRIGKMPITWVIAMTEGKEPRAVLRTLLRPGDKVVATSFDPVDGMPWVKPMHPDVILSVAKEVCQDINGLAIPKRGAYRALCAAKYLNKYASQSAHIVLTGSLYLVGDFFREHRAVEQALEAEDNISYIPQIDIEERNRVQQSSSVAGESVRSSKRPPVAALQQTASEDDGFTEADRLRQEISQLEEELAASLTVRPRSTSTPGRPSTEHALRRRSEVDAKPHETESGGSSSDSGEEGPLIHNPALDEELVNMRRLYGENKRQSSA